VRTCVGCRTRAPADGLLRVVAVHGVLVPDPRRRLPGRGAWLHPDPECLHRAERRSAFPRALRVPGPLDADQVRSHLQAAAAATPRTSTTGVREPPGPATDESKVDPS
jgi:uncharacterized protein